MADLARTGEAHGVPLQYFLIEHFLQNLEGNPKEYEEQFLLTCVPHCHKGTNLPKIIVTLFEFDIVHFSFP